MCVQISVQKTKTLSDFLGWDISDLAVNINNFALYQDYCKTLPSNFDNSANSHDPKHWRPKLPEKVRYVYSPTNAERELVLTNASNRIAQFDFNKRDIAGTQTPRQYYQDGYSYSLPENTKLGGMEVQFDNFPQPHPNYSRRPDRSFHQQWIRQHRNDSSF